MAEAPNLLNLPANMSSGWPWGRFPMSTESDSNAMIMLQTASTWHRAELSGLSTAGSVSAPKSLRTALKSFQVCVRPEEVQTQMDNSVKFMTSGLPPWPATTEPSKKDKIALAFLIQVSFADSLTIVKRTFDRIYSPGDVFVYLVDTKLMDPQKLLDTLPRPLPSNVQVQPTFHAGYYYWPRVQVVLDGFKWLLQYKWDFVVHLSETDFPVHNMSWIRSALGAQRQTNFIQIVPKCLIRDSRLVRDKWFWWSQQDTVASCFSAFSPTTVKGTNFPMAQMEKQGVRFARGPEWVILTRELVQYALSEELLPYHRLVSLRPAADEIFWQTLVLNIPRFSQRITSQGWFEKWSSTRQGHSPDTLTRQHEEAIAKDRERYFFMRKVKQKESEHLLKVLDDLSEKPEAPPGPVPESWKWNQDSVACSSEEMQGSQKRSEVWMAMEELVK